MPAVSAPNAAIIRRTSGAIDPCYLLIPPLTVAGTALVNGAPDYDAPVFELAIDNASADFEANTDRGAIVRITDPGTGALKYEGTLRRPPTTTLLSIEAIREGDTGTAQLFGQSIADNDVVTVYVQHGVGASLSYLASDGTLYKRRELAFDTGYPPSQYPEVHARIGSHRHARVAEGAEASLSFTDNSYDFIAQSLERTWHPPASWTQTTGTSTSATAVYDVPAGNHVLEMTASRVGGTEATDSNRAFRYVFVTDGPDGDNPAFSDLFKPTVENDTQDRTGREVTFKIVCDPSDAATLLTYLYPGAFCLMQETPRHSADGWATEGAASAGEVDHFCGHLRRYEVTVDHRGIQTWRVTFQSWIRYAADLPMPTQVLRVATPPTKWYEAHPDCMDVGCILWLWIFYHTDMGRFYDCYFEDLRDFHTPRTSVNTGTLYGALKEIVGLVTGANIGCVSSGALYARRHGSFESDATRNAIPTVWTWAAGDIAAEQAVARDPLLKVGQLKGAGLISTTSDTDYDAFAAEAGYLAPAQAPGRQDMPGFIAASASDVQARVGHTWQNMNRSVDHIPVNVKGMRDVIDPALMEWHKFDIDAYMPLETDAFSTTRRALPLTVSRVYTVTPTGVTKRITAQFEPETKGKPAPLVSLTGGEGAELGDPIQPLPAVEVTTPEEDPCSEDYGYDWCHEIDFTASNQGFAEIAADGGVYTGASGWEAEKSTFGYEVRVRGGVQKAVATAINTTCKRIEAVMTHTDGQGANYFYVVFGNSTANLTSAMPEGAMQVGAWTGSVNANGVAMLKIRFQTSTRSTIPASDPDPLGAFTLHKLRLWGNGTEPSW